MKKYGVESDIYLVPITKNADDYDEKYTKIKFNQDDDNMTIVVRAVFHENIK